MYFYFLLYLFITGTLITSTLYSLNSIKNINRAFFDYEDETNYNDDEDDNEDKDDNKDDNDKLPVNNVKQIYEEKYNTHFSKALNDNFNLIGNFKNNFIIENTPLGNVSMYYNSERECFEYYSDRVIPYRYLETVGKKYVYTFRCKDIFIDMKEELERQKHKQEDQEQEQQKQEQQKQEQQKQEQQKQEQQNQEQPKEKEQIPNKKRNLFVKLKNYNNGSIDLKKPVKSNPNSNQNQNQNVNLKTPTVFIKEKTNSFVCKGPFSNWNPLKPIKKTEVSEIYKMSFKDFKEMSQNKNL